MSTASLNHQFSSFKHLSSKPNTHVHIKCEIRQQSKLLLKITLLTAVNNIFSDIAGAVQLQFNALTTEIIFHKNKCWDTANSKLNGPTWLVQLYSACHYGPYPGWDIVHTHVMLMVLRTSLTPASPSIGLHLSTVKTWQMSAAVTGILTMFK